MAPWGRVRVDVGTALSPEPKAEMRWGVRIRRCFDSGLRALPTGSWTLLARRVLHWYPVDARPNGPSSEPWYAITGGFAFRTAAHYNILSPLAHFRLTDDAAYPTEHHPHGPSELPWFTIKGSIVYPAEGHSTARHSCPGTKRADAKLPRCARLNTRDRACCAGRVLTRVETGGCRVCTAREGSPLSGEVDARRVAQRCAHRWYGCGR